MQRPNRFVLLLIVIGVMLTACTAGQRQDSGSTSSTSRSADSVPSPSSAMVTESSRTSLSPTSRGANSSSEQSDPTTLSVSMSTSQSAAASPQIQVIPGDSTATPSISVEAPDAQAADGLDDLRHDGVQVGQPVRITGDASGGATLIRKYNAPVPDNSSAAFAYFDEDLGGWRVVPSALSTDRRTLTATVSHFSFWTDLVSEATFQVGKLFDTRVSAPSCQGKVPSWVDKSSIVFLDDQNAPLRWCVGSDPAHPDILVVKVAVNRGYGMLITPAVKPTWSWSSFLDRDPFQVASDLLTDADATISGALTGALSLPGSITPGGSELDLGFSEAAVRASGKPYLAIVKAGPPDPLQLTVSVLMKQLVEYSASKDVAYVAGILTATHCAAELVKVGGDWSEGASALLDCVSGAESVITQGLANYMLSSPKYANLSGTEIGSAAAKFYRFVKLIAAVGIAFQLATWAGDSTLVDAARTLSLGVTIARPAAPAATVVKVVSPVTADGSLKPGYSVAERSPGSADCYETRFISDSNGVYRCGTTADSLAACWKTSGGQMACMIDPSDTEVIRFVPTILGPYPEPNVVSQPWKMTLADGSVCRVRLGGAWDGRPDGLTGAYSCEGKSLFVLVDETTPSVDRSGPTWFVRVGDLGRNVKPTDKPVKIAVASAVLAGPPGS